MVNAKRLALPRRAGRLTAALQAPWWGVVWYWFALASGTVLLVRGDAWALGAVPLLIVAHHGAHEAVHGTLVPNCGTWRELQKALAFWSGVVGFGLVGHNFLLLRWSHMFHHACGRAHRECTIDESEDKRGASGRLRYFAGLLGVVYLYFELAGYLYLVVPAKWRLLDDSFRPKRYRNHLYLWAQLVVAAITTSLLFYGGVWFVFCKALFMMYWGLTQNVAHYGLEIGNTVHPELVSRTYRISRLWNAALFGAGYYHIEHHAFPRVPGLQLHEPGIRDALAARLGFRIRPRVGLPAYIRDVLNQFRGPCPEGVNRTEWRMDA